MKAGFGSADITPPPGCALAGSFVPRISEIIHYPLSADAVVVENASKRIRLASCDLISIQKAEADMAVELIRSNTGIPRENVIICGRHISTPARTGKAVRADYGLGETAA